MACHPRFRSVGVVKLLTSGVQRAVELSDRIDGRAERGDGSRPGRRDWALVGVLAVLVLAELIVEPLAGDDIDVLWSSLRLVPAAVSIGLLPWRRMIPLAAILVSFTVEAVYVMVANSSEPDLTTTFAGGVAGVVLIYSLCRWAYPRQVVTGAVVTVGIVIVEEVVTGSRFVGALEIVVPWGVIAFAALAMRYRARLKEQENLQIRLEERHGLARELHDTVAHHVSAIAVQAQAAQYVAASDPEAATEAMRSVETIATTALDEMRRMVGILRSEDDRDRTVVALTLDGLADPTGRPRVAMIGVSDLSELSAPIASAVFRIAQESITNARRHSRNVTFVDVELTLGPREVSLLVENDGAPTTRNAGSGYGLIGMSERVEALGGTLHTGPRPASGWAVDVKIPRRRRPDESNQ